MSSRGRGDAIIKAEQAVLGSVLLDNTVLSVAAGLISESSFLEPKHQAIWGALASLESESVAMDPTTLYHELEKSGSDKGVAHAYISSLESAVLSTQNIADHCKIIDDSARKRHFASTIRGILESDMSLDTADGLLASAQTKLTEQQRSVEKSTGPASKFAMAASDRFEMLRSLEEDLTGVPSGLSELDEMTGGFQKGDLICIAARPSVGKTALAVQILAHACLGLKKRALFFSLEMSGQSIINRFCASVFGVPLPEMRAPRRMSENMVNTYMRATRRVGSAPLYIDETAGIDIALLRARARQYREQHPDLSLVVIDYVQQITRSDGNKSDTRNDVVGAIARSLKALARDIDVPVAVLCQLGRRCDHEGRPPIMSDLRDSGEIEQEVDLGILLHRRLDKETGLRGLETKLIIGKHRNGACGSIDLDFSPVGTRFEEFTSGNSWEGR